MRFPYAIIIVLVSNVLFSAVIHAQVNWQSKLRNELPLLGHRNWIVIVDSAYPWQVSPGVETIETNDKPLIVLSTVLNEISKDVHVRPTCYTDAELAFVPESDALGISSYRTGLHQLIDKYSAPSLPHEQLISKLDDAGKTFHILILKTDQALPYTSVFIQLKCGYWTDEAEARLRNAMSKKP